MTERVIILERGGTADKMELNSSMYLQKETLQKVIFIKSNGKQLVTTRLESFSGSINDLIDQLLTLKYLAIEFD